MTAFAINKSQNQLLGEMISIIPQYDGVEVINVLKEALRGLKKCKKISSTTIENDSEIAFSPEVASLIGIVPEFTEEEIMADERLHHILEH